MLTKEWNLEDAKRVWKEEGRELGRSKGLSEGRTEGRTEVLDLVRQGYTAAQIKGMLAAAPAAPGSAARL